jgi:hypothetical protein
LTEAAQYARFSETAVRVARNSSAPPTTSSVNAVSYYRGFRGSRGRNYNNRFQRGGFGQHGFRGTMQKPFYRGRQQGPPQMSVTRNFGSHNRTVNVTHRGGIRCYNCGRLGHMARDCRSQKPQHSIFGGRRGRGRFQNRVSAVQQSTTAPLNPDQRAEASGYTANSINSIPSGTKRESPFSSHRKLCSVSGIINNQHYSQILIDSGSPVTIARSDLWRQLRDPRVQLEEEPEDFQGVTQDGLRIIGITRLNIHLGGLLVAHPVLIADGIAHKFILGNDFLTEHRFDILNSNRVLYLDESAYRTRFFARLSV